MMFLCEYSKKDAVAAHGSNAGSVFSGVSVGAGRMDLTVVAGFDVEELCRECCPTDMLAPAVIDASVSKHPFHRPCS